MSNQEQQQTQLCTPKNQPGQSFSSILVNPSSWFAPCTAQGGRGVALTAQSSLPEPNPPQNPEIFPKPAPPLLISHLFPSCPCPRSTKTRLTLGRSCSSKEKLRNPTVAQLLIPQTIHTKILLQSKSRNSTTWGTQHLGPGWSLGYIWKFKS